jgi:hypothetical protein
MCVYIVPQNQLFHFGQNSKNYKFFVQNYTKSTFFTQNVNFSLNIYTVYFLYKETQEPEKKYYIKEITLNRGEI